jgi:hypothetical protein
VDDHTGHVASKLIPAVTTGRRHDVDRKLVVDANGIVPLAFKNIRLEASSPAAPSGKRASARIQRTVLSRAGLTSRSMSSENRLYPVRRWRIRRSRRIRRLPRAGNAPVASSRPTSRAACTQSSRRADHGFNEPCVSITIGLFVARVDENAFGCPGAVLSHLRHGLPSTSPCTSPLFRRFCPPRRRCARQPPWRCQPPQSRCRPHAPA